MYTALFYRCIHRYACSRLKNGTRINLRCTKCPHFLDEDTYSDMVSIQEARKYISDGKRLVRLGVCPIDEAFTVKNFGRGDTIGEILCSLTGQEESVQF